MEWHGDGVNEKRICNKTEKSIVEVDSKYFHPSEVEQLLGDPLKVRTKLGWNFHKTLFEKLVKIMIEHYIKSLKKLYLKS